MGETGAAEATYTTSDALWSCQAVSQIVRAELLSHD